jgi:hypothetical protein
VVWTRFSSPVIATPATAGGGNLNKDEDFDHVEIATSLASSLLAKTVVGDHFTDNPAQLAQVLGMTVGEGVNRGEMPTKRTRTSRSSQVCTRLVSSVLRSLPSQQQIGAGRAVNLAVRGVQCGDEFRDW